MDSRRKTSLGAALASISGAGIALSAIFGWTSLARPWGFDLARIALPAYLWQGEADVVVTPAMGRYLAERIPHCQVRFVPQAGHLLFLAHWQGILGQLVAAS